MKTVAVIPCFNEENTINEVVTLTKKYVDRVVVVNNSSTDNTEQVARLAGAEVIANQNRRGAGASTWLGIQWCLLHYVPNSIITLDGDMQHDPEEIPKLLSLVVNNEADVVIGSRLSDSRGRMPSYRRVGNYLLSWLFNVGKSPKFTDTQCGFRAYRSDVFDTFKVEEDDYSFCSEVLVKARAKGLRVKETSVRCIYHTSSQDHSAHFFVHGLTVFLKTLKWRLKYDILPLARETVFRLFLLTTKPFVNRGIGNIRFLSKTYRRLEGMLLPKERKAITVNDCTMVLETTSIDGIERQLIYDKKYEPVTTKVLRSYLGVGMNAVDVGSNIGYYTLLFAKRVGYLGRVWSFEPEEKNFRQLLENIKRNRLDNVLPAQKAISNTLGMSKLYVSSEESGEHSLVVKRHCKSVVNIETTTIDETFHDTRVDVLKIDTEGNDIRVLLGAERLLTENSPLLVVEFWPEGIVKGGYTPQQFWELLLSYGFKHIYIANEIKKTLILGSLTQALNNCSDHGFSVNLICMKEEYVLAR